MKIWDILVILIQCITILIIVFVGRDEEVIRGYNFLVNAVWPEIVSNVEARTPSIFAPGNPNVFHEVNSIENYIHIHCSCNAKKLEKMSVVSCFPSNVPVLYLGTLWKFQLV